MRNPRSGGKSGDATCDPLHEPDGPAAAGHPRSPVRRLPLICYHCRRDIAGDAKTVTMPGRRWLRPVQLTVRLHQRCYRSMLRDMGSEHLVA